MSSSLSGARSPNAVRRMLIVFAVLSQICIIALCLCVRVCKYACLLSSDRQHVLLCLYRFMLECMCGCMNLCKYAIMYGRGCFVRFNSYSVPLIATLAVVPLYRLLLAGGLYYMLSRSDYFSVRCIVSSGLFIGIA